MAERPWLIAWGLGSVAVGAASLLIPLYVVELGGDAFTLGLLGAVAAVFGTPGAVLWGRLADRVAHPQRIAAGGLVASGLALAATALVTDVFAVVVLNAVLLLAFAAGGPVVVLLVVAGAPESQWSTAIARLNKYQGYGWAGGLLAGIVWAATVGQFLSARATQQSLAVVTGVVAVVAGLLLARWLPSPRMAVRQRVDPRRVARVLGAGRAGVRGATFAFVPTRLFWATRQFDLDRALDRFSRTLAGYFVAVVLFFVGFTAFFAPLPAYLADLSFGDDAVFALYLVGSLGSAVAYDAAGGLAERHDLRLVHAAALGSRGVAFGALVAVAGLLGASLVGTVAVGVVMVAVGVTWAVIAVSAGSVVTRLAPASVRGEALGTYAALSTLAAGIGSLLGGGLATTYGFAAAAAAGAALVVAGGALVVALRGISARSGGIT